MKVVNLALKKQNHLDKMYVGMINYLKFMKRKIWVEIWINSVDGDHKEAKNQKRVFKWYPKEANMHESQENSWAVRCHQATKVDYRPKICEIRK